MANGFSLPLKVLKLHCDGIKLAIKKLHSTSFSLLAIFAFYKFFYFQLMQLFNVVLHRYRFYRYSDSPIYTSRPMPITDPIISSWELYGESALWKLFCGFSLGSDICL